MNIKKLHLLIITVFISFVLTPFVFAQVVDWDITYYSRFTFESFKNYAPANKPIDFNNIDYPLLNAAVFYETNRIRIQNNRSRFKHSQALEDASMMHSYDMVDKNFFSHNNPYDRSKYTPFDRMGLFGVKNTAMAENISDDFGIQYKSGTMVSNINAIPPHTYNSYAENLVDGWMNSPGHRANILNSSYNYLGCGSWFYMNDNVWPMFKATQKFARNVPDESAYYSSNTNTGQSVKSFNNSPNNQIYKYSGGYFINLGNGEWEERIINGVIFYYLEYERDDSYIYLLDNNGRDFFYAIPLNGGIAYADWSDGRGWIEWYKLDY